MSRDVEIPKEIRDLLSPSEKVLYVAKQKGSKFRPDLGKRIFPGMMVLTDRRILRMQPKGLVGGAFGARSYIDYPYESMKSIFLDRGAFRTGLKITWKSAHDTGRYPEIRDIEKDEAEDIYGILREILERQQSKTSSPSVVVPMQTGSESESPIQQLEKLGKLKDAGVITEEEFQEKKKELLKKI